MGIGVLIRGPPRGLDCRRFSGPDQYPFGSLLHGSCGQRCEFAWPAVVFGPGAGDVRGARLVCGRVWPGGARRTCCPSGLRSSWPGVVRELVQRPQPWHRLSGHSSCFAEERDLRLHPGRHLRQSVEHDQFTASSRSSMTSSPTATPSSASTQQMLTQPGSSRWERGRRLKRRSIEVHAPGQDICGDIGDPAAGAEGVPAQ